MDRWLDNSNGFGQQTIYSRLIAIELTYIPQRTCGLHLSKLTNQGVIALRLYTDRFNGKGMQKCLKRVAIDGSTIIDEDTPMKNMGANRYRVYQVLTSNKKLNLLRHP